MNSLLTVAYIYISIIDEPDNNMTDSSNYLIREQCLFFEKANPCLRDNSCKYPINAICEMGINDLNFIYIVIFIMFERKTNKQQLIIIFI